MKHFLDWLTHICLHRWRDTVDLEKDWCDWCYDYDDKDLK